VPLPDLPKHLRAKRFKPFEASWDNIEMVIRIAREIFSEVPDTKQTLEREDFPESTKLAYWTAARSHVICWTFIMKIGDYHSLVLSMFDDTFDLFLRRDYQDLLKDAGIYSSCDTLLRDSRYDENEVSAHLSYFYSLLYEKILGQATHLIPTPQDLLDPEDPESFYSPENARGCPIIAHSSTTSPTTGDKTLFLTNLLTGKRMKLELKSSELAQTDKEIFLEVPWKEERASLP